MTGREVEVRRGRYDAAGVREERRRQSLQCYGGDCLVACPKKQRSPCVRVVATSLAKERGVYSGRIRERAKHDGMMMIMRALPPLLAHLDTDGSVA